MRIYFRVAGNLKQLLADEMFIFTVTTDRNVTVRYRSSQPCWWTARRQQRVPHQDPLPTMDWRLLDSWHNCCLLGVPAGPCCRRLPSMTDKDHTSWKKDEPAGHCSWKSAGWVPRSRSDARTLHQLQKLVTVFRSQRVFYTLPWWLISSTFLHHPRLFLIGLLP